MVCLSELLPPRVGMDVSVTTIDEVRNPLQRPALENAGCVLNIPSSVEMENNMSKNFVISKEVFDSYVREKKRARDETIQWPTSFGHGFTSGKVEACMELEQMAQLERRVTWKTSSDLE